MEELKLGDRVKYKTSKKSLQVYYGNIIGFKEDKIKVTKFKYSDYSGRLVSMYIERGDLIK